MEFDTVEPGGNGAFGGVFVALHNVFDLLFFQLLGRRTAENLASRHLARRQHVGIVFVRVARWICFQKGRRRPQPEMQELHRDRAAVPLYRARHVGQSFELRVVPKTREPERRIDRVLVNQVAAQNDHSEAGFGAFLVIGDGLLREDPLMWASHPRWTNGSKYGPVW